MTDFRQHIRFACEHPLWLRPSGYGDDAYQLAQIQNISEGGALVVTSDPLKVNQVLDMSMEIPRDFRMVSMRGPVKHIKRHGRYFYCGLAFEEFRNTTRETLSDCINQNFTGRPLTQGEDGFGEFGHGAHSC